MKNFSPFPTLINPLSSMPAEQFGRSRDQIPPPSGTGGGGGGEFAPPLWLTQVDDTNVLVKFGQVNGITPTNVATNIDVSGTDGTWSIYIHATLGADGIPTAVEVLSGTTGVPADDSTNSYRLIGEADVAAAIITAIRTSMAWSQEFVACGRDPADPTTTPGTYYWQVA